MNRSAAQLDELIQELSAHHGDEAFAIIGDIVRANSSDTDETIFNTVASVLGGTPYVRPVKVLRRPQEPNLAPPTAIRVPPPSTALPPSYPVAKPATSILPTHSSANPFEALDSRHKKGSPAKPLQSVWKAVVNEHHADTYTETPLKRTTESPPRFEDVDMSALEDVDPVAFQIAQNPDFFKDVPTSDTYTNMHIDQKNEPTHTSSATITPEEHRPPTKRSEPNLAAQTLILDSDDEQGDSSTIIPNYLRFDSQPSGLPAWITNSNAASFVARNHLSTSSSRVAIAPVADSSSSSTISMAEGAKKPSSESIDFFLPHYPANEQEAKRIQEMLALGASGQHNMRASSGWSASGEYAIAPSPSTLRQSSSGIPNAAKPVEVVDLTHLSDEEPFVLDAEALDFLGQIFPDFEPSYLADCLRGANNDVERVSEFLMPIEMEEIAIDEEVPFDESLYMHDPSSPLPQFEMPAHLLKDAEYMQVDAPYMEEEEVIEIEDDEVLPEEDAAFNDNYHALVEIYPHVPRDWVLDALINTDNDLARAADLLMRGLTVDPSEEVAAVEGANGSAQKPTNGGKRGRNRRAKKVAIKLPPPNAWARRPVVASDAPLSEYPMLSTDVPEYYDGQHAPIRIRPVPTLPFAGARDGSPQVPHKNVTGSYRDVMNSKLPAGVSRERAYGTLILKKMLEDEAALRTTYVSVEDREHAKGNWALLMARANALFEETNGGRHAAVAAFARNRRVGAVSVISQLQATNESWMKLVEEAGEQFYVARISTLDLHGLRLRPASKLVAAILQTHWTQGHEQRSLEIITGRGAHSVAGIARIKEDIRRQVRDYYHVWTNPGCVKVLLPQPSH